MSSQYSTGQQQVRISAGTALKIGFFGALGAFLFSLILWLIGVVVVLVLLASGFTLRGLVPGF